MMQSEKQDKLRKLAIAELKNRQVSLTDESIDLQTAMEELKIYHVELEHQNENLQETQETLQQNIERFDALFTYAPIGYITFDDAYTIQQANIAACTLLCCDHSGFIEEQVRITHFIDRESQDEFYFHTQRVFSQRVIDSCDIRVNTKQGDLFVRLQSQLDPTRTAGQNDLILCSIIDITPAKQLQQELFESNLNLQLKIEELQKMQQDLVRQERLSAVGQLAAGVAHDFNNILTSIIGYTELMQDRNTDQILNDYIQEIARASDRASTLVKQLLDFSSKGIGESAVFDLRGLVSSWYDFIKHSLSEDINFTIDICDSDLHMYGKQNQIHQMLTNLVFNARDALQDRRSIHVSLESTDDHGALLIVEDSGVGIPEHLQERIFEPFYTTKQVGKGTGLGLSQVFGIVRQHKGSIHVTSQEGVGSCFTIELPLSKEKVSTESAHGAAKKLMQHSYSQDGPRATILLVEDDVQLKDVQERLLERKGFTIHSASDGLTGLKMFLQHRDEVDIILSDVVMPVVGGYRLSRDIREIDPHIPIILMSGYPLQARTEGEIPEGVIWLRKPFSFSQLLHMIEEQLSMSE